MKPNTPRNSALVILLLLIVTFLPTSLLAEEHLSISMSPATILIGAQFDGTQLQVNGTVPAESDVILRFTGASSEIHLREKGKVFGLLWMNIGKVTLKNVPKVCIVDTSNTFDKLGPAASPYNLEGLLNAIAIEKDVAGEGIDIRQELLLLKLEEGLYSESELGVSLSPKENNIRNFSATLPIPPALAPGKYQIEVVAIHDGKVVAQGTSAIDAKMVGFPLWLSNLAFDKSLLYGVMATVIALVSGLAIGLVFQSRGAH